MINILNIIEKFIQNMKRDDIVKFAHKNHLNVSDHEIDFVYKFIKSNYQNVLNNPNSLDISLYKNEFSQDNYLFLESLINKYKRMIIR